MKYHFFSSIWEKKKKQKKKFPTIADENSSIHDENNNVCIKKIYIYVYIPKGKKTTITDYLTLSSEKTK
jgi:hypothetical protein